MLRVRKEFAGGQQKVRNFIFLQKLLLIPKKLLCKHWFFWMYSSLVSLLTPSPLHIPLGSNNLYKKIPWDIYRRKTPKYRGMCRY